MIRWQNINCKTFIQTLKSIDRTEKNRIKTQNYLEFFITIDSKCNHCNHCKSILYLQSDWKHHNYNAFFLQSKFSSGIFLCEKILIFIECLKTRGYLWPRLFLKFLLSSYYIPKHIMCVIAYWFSGLQKIKLLSYIDATNLLMHECTRM